MKKLKKSDGSIPMMFAAFMTIIVLFILIDLCVSESKLNDEGVLLHNALVASNLAAEKDYSIGELSEYPLRNDISLNTNEAYNTFQTYLKKNMHLNDNFTSNNKIISGKLIIKDFIIYNVDAANNITVYKLNADTGGFSRTVYSNGVGTVKTPKGNIVRKTTIHSSVSFDMEGMMGSSKLKTALVSEDTAIRN